MRAKTASMQAGVCPAPPSWDEELVQVPAKNFDCCGCCAQRPEARQNCDVIQAELETRGDYCCARKQALEPIVPQEQETPRLERFCAKPAARMSADPAIDAAARMWPNIASPASCEPAPCLRVSVHPTPKTLLL
mmetsp:Transcript_113587/g.196916  ORF Transcript_113587/g.196916 Transcript_113587/m.196916 type:complete len:134 (-) Transcript_113587:370-771(-)